MTGRSGPGWMRRHRTVLLITTTVVMAALIVGGVLFALRWSDRAPGPASFDEAIEEFRASSTSEAPATGSTGPERATLGAPLDGVYAYEGEGSERLSLLGTDQPQGPELPATVTELGAGCWSFEIAYNEHHSQDWEYCDRDGTLVEAGGGTSQEFDFVAFQVRDRTEFTCDPPGLRVDPAAQPGDSWLQECTGRSDTQGTTTTSSGSNTFVGIEEITVANEQISTYHYRMERTIGGDQSGATTEDVWFALDTMLPVREERSSQVESPAPAPLDSVTYTESGSWQLADPEPRR